jgi:hypothetical protein
VARTRRCGEFRSVPELTLLRLERRELLQAKYLVKSPLVPIYVVIAAAVLAGVALGIRSAASSPADTEPPSSSATRVWGPVATDLGLLTGPAEGMPKTLSARVALLFPGQRDFFRFSRSQFVHTLDGPIWITPNRHLLCITQARYATTACSPLLLLKRRGATLGVFDPKGRGSRWPQRFCIYGVVRDSVRSVSLRVGHHIRPVVVQNNSYSLCAKRPIGISAVGG